MRQREDDEGTSMLRIPIRREVPLVAVIGSAATLIAMIGVWLVGMYMEQRDQGGVLRSIQATNTEINRRIDEMQKDLGQKNSKDIEHDLKIADHERRLLTIEQRMHSTPAGKI